MISAGTDLLSCKNFLKQHQVPKKSHILNNFINLKWVLGEVEGREIDFLLLTLSNQVK